MGGGEEGGMLGGRKRKIVFPSLLVDSASLSLLFSLCSSSSFLLPFTRCIDRHIDRVINNLLFRRQ